MSRSIAREDAPVGAGTPWPLVSVVIIFYNGEAFLAEAIESVLAQTYDHWELLLVDDGSTDGSTWIARRYANQHSESVRYLEHEGHVNRGMSPTRNLGLRHVRGTYVAFLDADDVWLPNKLTEQVEILESRPNVALVYGPGQWWYSWMGDRAAGQRDFTTEAYLPRGALIEPPKLLAHFLRKDSGIAPPSGVLVRREAIERVGGFEESFPGHFQLYEDKAFYAKVCLQAPAFVSRECWYRYRRHPDACGSSVVEAGQYNTVRLRFLNWLAQYLTQQGVDDHEVWRVLRRELWHSRHPSVRGALREGQARALAVKGLVVRTISKVLPADVRSWLRDRLPGTWA
jgi:glycosyltransferase involved in cell wall biosynthesis